MLTWDFCTGWRRWARRALAHLAIGLSLVGGIDPTLTAGLLAGAEEAAPQNPPPCWPGGTAPQNPPPGHPERLAGHVPPSEEEAALWRDLGWRPRTVI